MGMNKIKYDKRDKKIYLVLAVVTTIIFAVCFSLLQMDLEVENLSAAFYASFMIVSTSFCLLLALLCGLCFLSVICT